MWSQYSHLNDTRARFQAAQRIHEDVANAYHVAAGELAETTEGATSEALILAHQELAVDHNNIGLLLGHLDEGLRQAIQIQYELNQELDRIDAETHRDIAAALPAERQAIITAGHARAVAAHSEFVGRITGLHAGVQGRVEPIVAGIVMRGGLPTDKPDPTQELDNNGFEHRPDKNPESTTNTGLPKKTKGDNFGLQQREDYAETPSPGPIASPAPLSPLGSGIGGQGGGGLTGLGSGSPLPAFTSGMGQVSGTAGGAAPGISAGASGLPGTATPIGQPSTAFTQGLAAGTGIGTPVPSLAPATGTGTPAPGTGPGAGGASTAGISGAAAATPSPGIGAAGTHIPPIAAASAEPSAMIVPPPGMGAPAAPGSASVTPPGATTSFTNPAGGATGSSGNSTVGPAPTGTAGAGATLVPAGVVRAGGATAGRGRIDSPELTAAKALARQLRRDSDAAGYAVIEWTVGVFRSESDGTTETVFISNEGSGYIPRGVFVPRSAQLLTVDCLLDSSFRDRWFGWRDPTRILIEYARLRSQRGARLVAATATNRIEPLRVAGVECALCQRERSTQTSITPVLDDMHAHRLAVQCPDIYPRIARLTVWNDTAVLNQLVVPLAVQMIDAVQSGSAGVDCPPELRQMWDALGSGDELSEKDWEEFELATDVYYATAGASSGRPGYSDETTEIDTSGHSYYRAQWLIARTMELVRGWARRPPPLADMVYASAAAYPGDFAAKIDPMLRLLEREAGTA